MWCLETILAVNQEAAKLARAGEPERKAYERIGILMPVKPEKEKEDKSCGMRSPVPLKKSVA